MKEQNKTLQDCTRRLCTGMQGVRASERGAVGLGYLVTRSSWWFQTARVGGRGGGSATHSSSALVAEAAILLAGLPLVRRSAFGAVGCPKAEPERPDPGSPAPQRSFSVCVGDARTLGETNYLMDDTSYETRTYNVLSTTRPTSSHLAHGDWAS
ncbi:hypothetical protein LX36DRAFT_416969 [Colletotrichum falcatum]|nr:hypothetical protein LX36DRAFT_416969 [Colletotrichum falcatum]